MAKNKGGRPTVMTPEVVQKLEEVFAIDGTVEEACFYADIARQTYYEWIKENPAFNDRFTALRERPVLKARQTVVKSLDNPDNAFRYLERKKKNEFSTRNEFTGKDGEALTLDVEFKNKIDNSIATYLKGKE
jgi:hypothetical protein